MAEEWFSFLDPQSQTFTLGLCLLTLFLPVNHNKHHIWINKFRDLWVLYRSVPYDFQFLELFARLARENYSDIPWEDLLPFIFNIASIHMGIPSSLLETSIPQAVNFHPELYTQFFKDVATLDVILKQFATIIVYLLSGDSTRDLARSYLQRLIHIIAPLCSTNQTDEESDCDAPIVFIDHIVGAFCKRVKADRDFSDLVKCPPLTSDDKTWITELLLPLVYITQFHENPPITSINKFVQLCPPLTIPSILSTIEYCFEFEHLKNSAIQAMISISPTVFNTQESMAKFMALVMKVPEEISFMDTTKSSAAFSILAIVATSMQLGPEHEPFVIQIATKCIQFAEHAIGEDFTPSLGELLTTLSSIIYSIPTHTAHRIATLIFNKSEDIPERALSVLVEALDMYGPPVFMEKAFQGKTLRDFTILKALARQTNQFYLDHMDKLTEVILTGFFSTEKKIYEETVSCMKWFLKNLVCTYPLIPKKRGFTNDSKMSLNWHCPTDDEIEKADKLAESCLSAAREFTQSKNKAKQILGAMICRGVIKGIISGVSSEDLEHENEREGFCRPQLARFHSPKLAARFEEAATILLDFINSETAHPVAIAQAISYLETANEPRDSVANELDGLTTEYNYHADNGRAVILEYALDFLSHNMVYWRGLLLYSLRHSLDHVFFPKITRRVLETIFRLATHPNEKVRTAAACYVTLATNNFKNHFLDLYDAAITTLEKVGATNPTPEEQQEIQQLGKHEDVLSGLSEIVAALPNCTMNADTFWMLMRAAIAVCIQLSPDDHLDATRSLRQFIVICLDQTDTSDSEFNTSPPFVEKRKWLAREAMRRHTLYPSNRETQNYAAALVCSVLFGQPLIFDHDIIQFIVKLMSTDDRIVRDCVIQIMPSIIEAMIPRVPRPDGVKVSEITPENYDIAYYEDRRMPTQAKKMPKFLTREEYLDRETVKRYFPNENPDERVKMHKYLFEHVVDSTEPIDTLITLLVDAQVHKEDNFSKSRVLFWCALCRFFGFEFEQELFSRADKMITDTSNVAQHVVAAEIFAGVLHSLKSRPYEHVQKVAQFVCPFVTRLLATAEPEFHSLWYFSFFACFNEMDPRRLFWLYNHILTCVPTDDNLRAARAVSLIADVLLDVAYRIPSLGQKIQDIAAQPLFSNAALEFEQIRECSVRALVSMVSLTFDPEKRGNNPLSFEILNRFASRDSKDVFVMRFLVGAFGAQSLATLSAGKFALENLHHWIEMVVDKDEVEEQLARAAMISIANSNWIGSIADLPLTKQGGTDVANRVIAELSKPSNPWQVQTIAILLIESFIASVFFYVEDETLFRIIEEIVLPALSHQHTDVQDASSQLLTFILHCSMSAVERIPSYVERFSHMLRDSSIQTRLAGAKGLCSIINATPLFDDVPQFVIDCFQLLTDAMETDKTVEQTIAQFFSDFWSTNEGNLLKTTAEILTPFKASLRPSYFT